MIKNTIKEMIEQADDERNLDLIRSIKEILDTFASTINCPSNWQYLGMELTEEYPEDSWVYENIGQIFSAYSRQSNNLDVVRELPEKALMVSFKRRRYI